jgi:N,N'-diacetyllegionaminate synthase
MMLYPELQLEKGKKIGKGNTPYTIAEIGTNHDQSLSKCKNLIVAVAESGFDCVKFQTYEPFEIVSNEVRANDYGLDSVYGDISAYEMFDSYLKTPKEWFPELIKFSRSLGLDVATTIHGEHGIAWVDGLDFDLIKVASMDHNNFPFLDSLVKNLKCPILISFGMAKIEDIEAAIAILRRHEWGVGMFHCVSIYPPKVEEMRLANVKYFSERFSLVTGLSDHTDDVVSSLAAYALGARIFEKHVTLNRKDPGPDHPFALNPQEMKEYVNGLKVLHDDLSLNNFIQPVDRERRTGDKYLKSLVASKALRKGRKLQHSDLSFARPGTEIPPGELATVIGCRLLCDLNAGDLLKRSFLDVV